MKVIKVGFPGESSISSEDKFIANCLNPIAIRKIDKDKFLVLFSAFQNLGEKFIYIQILFKIDNTEDEIYINNNEIYLNNILNDENRAKIYFELINNMKENNIYSTGLDFKADKNYYKIRCIRPNKLKKADLLNLYFDRSTYIRLVTYIHFLHLHVPAACQIFTNKMFNNIEFVKIEEIKLNASSEISKDLVMTHYTLNCGPSTFKINFPSKPIPRRKLKEPLDVSLYNPLYKDDFVVSNIITEEDRILLLYQEYKDDKPDKMKVLIINEDLIPKTNFLDPENIYYKLEII